MNAGFFGTQEKKKQKNQKIAMAWDCLRIEGKCTVFMQFFVVVQVLVISSEWTTQKTIDI